MYKGMHIQADFAKPEMLDRVTVDCSHDEPAMRLRLEGEDSSGHWKTLPENRVEAETTIPDLRREAIRELKRRRITHLLMHPPFPGAEDMAANPQAWGLRFLGEIEDTRLYELQ